MADIRDQMALGPSRGRLTSDICHPIPALQIVNHDKSIIVSSLSMPLRLLGEARSLLHHVSRPMKLARIDPFASFAKHEATAARQPRNTAQPVRRLGPPHLDTPAAPSEGFSCASIPVARTAIATRPQATSSARWRSCSLPAICCAAAEHANNWYHPSAESRPRRAARLFWRAVDSGYNRLKDVAWQAPQRV